MRGSLVACLGGIRAVDCGWEAGVAEEVGTTRRTGVVNERAHLDVSLVLSEAFGGRVGRGRDVSLVLSEAFGGRVGRVEGQVVSTGGRTGEGGRG